MAREYVLSAPLARLMDRVLLGYSTAVMVDYMVAYVQGKITVNELEAINKAHADYLRFVKNYKPEVAPHCQLMTITLAMTTISLQPFLTPTIARCFSDSWLWQMTIVYQSVLLFYRGYFESKTGTNPFPYDEDTREPEKVSIPEFDDFVKVVPKTTKIILDVGLETLGAVVPEGLKIAVKGIPEAIKKEQQRQAAMIKTGLLVGGVFAAAWLVREVKRR